MQVSALHVAGDLAHSDGEAMLGPKHDCVRDCEELRRLSVDERIMLVEWRARR